MKTTIKKTKIKEGLEIQTLTNNVEMFGKSFIAMKSRDCDMLEYFSHEMQPFPPSLSVGGKMNLPKSKSDIIEYISPKLIDHPQLIDCKIKDGAVLEAKNSFITWLMRL